MLKKLSEKTGFTQTELKVTSLLLAIFIIGFSYKTFVKDRNTAPLKNFDYSKDDSTFFSSGNETDTSLSKDDILELDKKDERNFTSKITAPENSVDINKAGIDIIATIPGIGPKTAESIVALRNKLGRFRSLNDLLRVKNIGLKKLDKIKKYTYIK